MSTLDDLRKNGLIEKRHMCTCDSGDSFPRL